MKFTRYLAWLMVVMAAVSLHACGKSSSSTESGTPSSAPSGAVTVKLTDAPGDFDRVYITVKDIWFHVSDSSGPQEPGWIKKPLDPPATVDLLSLGNGGLQTLWSGVTLAAGDYQQIRLVLADTDDPLTASASTANNGSSLQFNNEVIVNGAEYPLQIPDARHGIRLAGHFKIVDGGTLTLAIDFDAGHDVVELEQGTEYVLKPRLRYFDLDNAGAIIGSLSTGATFTRAPRFVIKAESLSDDGTYHVVNRWTVPNTDGSFVLYPLSTAATSTYDVLIRGLNYQTVIIKGVPVIKGSTKGSGATNIGTIAMTAATASDFVSNGSITSPTGAWVNFYQTLPDAGSVPYEVRFRHFHPIAGNYATYPLSSEPLLMGTYGMTPITMSTVTPLEGVGGFKAVAEAILYDRSGYSSLITAGSPTVIFGPLAVQSPWTGNTISGSVTMNNPLMMKNVMNRGFLFVAHGGMIVSAINVGAQMGSGGAYSMTNIPGGTAAKPLPLAFYGVDAVGWDSLHPLLHHKAVAVPEIADIRTGSATGVDLNMLPLW